MKYIVILFFCIIANGNGYDDIHDNRSLLDRIKERTNDERRDEASGEIEEQEDDDEKTKRSNVYDFLYKRLKQDADADGKRKRKRLTPNVYMIPGPQEPLPGRSHLGDYWPVFPFQNQFSGGLDLDPSISRHIGGDLNIAVPSWGMLDIYGRFFNRIHDTTTKFGYLNYPVNMLDLEKQDFVQLMSDPSLQYNRNAQPRLPLGKLARTYVPINCKPPMCNPYHASFGFGMEHDYGGNDGVEGDIDVPIPISKGVAYRLPISGKIYAFRDNITVTYGQNLAPVDPFMSLFEYQKYRDPALAIPRRRRDVSYSTKVWQDEPTSATFEEHLKSLGETQHEISSMRQDQLQRTRHLPQRLLDRSYFPKQLLRSIPFAAPPSQRLWYEGFQEHLKSLGETQHEISSMRQDQLQMTRRLPQRLLDRSYFPNQLLRSIPFAAPPSQRLWYEDLDTESLLYNQFISAPLIERISWLTSPPWDTIPNSFYQVPFYNTAVFL